METQRIALDTPGELERWAGQLGVTPQQLRQAIDAVGTEIDKLKSRLAVQAGLRGTDPPGDASAGE